MTRDDRDRQFDVALDQAFANLLKTQAETTKLNKEASTIPWLPLVVALLGSNALIAAVLGYLVGSRH